MLIAAMKISADMFCEKSYAVICKTTEKVMKDFNFKVDLKGIIRLLSENLYSSRDIFLRELLSNAMDAIEARTQAD